jgi:membrane protease YdiL (CAAX protease family)
MPVTATARPAKRSPVLVVLGAVLLGLIVGMIAANVWPVLLLNLKTPVASVLEIVFLTAYIFWVSGGGPPHKWRAFRSECSRVRGLTSRDWLWGIIAAVSFAATVHASIVVLFRFIPYPAASFHRGYDFSFIPTPALKWLACVISAISAGVCEETGFRGYMQRPIERRIGPGTAILVSSFFFTLIHLTKSWALLSMVPIVFGAGLLLGWMARASRSLVFCIVGHTIMDVGLFAYWWTQIAGVFPQKPIFETRVDSAFLLECTVLLVCVSLTLVSIRKLSRTPASS